MLCNKALVGQVLIEGEKVEIIPSDLVQFPLKQDFNVELKLILSKHLSVKRFRLSITDLFFLPICSLL